MSQAKLGFQAKAYRLTTGTRAAWPGTGAPASLSEITNLQDVTLPFEAGEADVSIRGGGGFELVAATLIKVGVELNMIYDTTDTHLTALITAFFARTTVAIALMDQADTVTGAQGAWADWSVLGFEKGEPIDGAQTVKVKIKPGYSAVPPAWVTVA